MIGESFILGEPMEDNPWWRDVAKHNPWFLKTSTIVGWLLPSHLLPIWILLNELKEITSDKMNKSSVGMIVHERFMPHTEEE